MPGRFGRRWRDALDAKAFQQEQAAGQVVSTCFILANGVVIGLVTASVFMMLAQFIEESALW